ncbi:hypothetical protein TNCV_2674471 [Trichonephila clavipes]|nr:hypothetical protein TNCV_2674471 [Trichonephila clavipes]
MCFIYPPKLKFKIIKTLPNRYQTTPPGSPTYLSPPNLPTVTSLLVLQVVSQSIASLCTLRSPKAVESTLDLSVAFQYRSDQSTRTEGRESRTAASPRGKNRRYCQFLSSVSFKA